MTTAGWYDDPEGSGQERWWDGVGWTENLRAMPLPQPAMPDAPPPLPTAAQPPSVHSPSGHVDPWLWQSILATILSCCFVIYVPLGIVAIVFAAKSNGALQRNDFQQAQDSAKVAKVLTLVLLGLAGVSLLSFFAFPLIPSLLF